jgi:hypothetical protein
MESDEDLLYGKTLIPYFNSRQECPPYRFFRRCFLKSPSIHDGIIICTFVTTPFDKLRVTGHGEPIELCVGYSLGNDGHAQ